MANPKEPDASAHWKAAREELGQGNVLGASAEELKALGDSNRSVQGPAAVAHWEDAQQDLKAGHLIDASINEIKALSTAATKTRTDGKAR